jgi:hypothetical protein
MKKFAIILLIFFSNIIFSQSKNVFSAPPAEIFLIVNLSNKN